MNKPEFVINPIKQDNSYAKLSVQPLDRGYGHTVGNALRRVLLSSIKGAAVSQVRI